MYISLNLPSAYDGLVYIFDAEAGAPSMRSHSHCEWEVNLVIEGSLIYQVEGQKLKLSPGCMIWFRSGIEHQVIERSPTCRKLVIAFKPRMLSRLDFHPKDWQGLRKKGYMARNLDANDAAFIVSIGRHILDDHVDHVQLNAGLGYGQDNGMRYEHNDVALLNGGLHFLLTSCWQVFQRGREFHSGGSLHPSVARALEYLRKSREPITLSELACRCGTTPSHLSSLFRRQVGVRLTEYRNTLRIESFLALYGNGGERTVLEACFESGFGSYAQFAKVFRKTYRQGPRAYARELQLKESPKALAADLV